MTTPTMLTVTVVIVLFASFAGTLAWVQQHARSLSTAPAETFRRKRRPF